MKDPSQEATHSTRNLSVSESSQDSYDDLMEELGLRASQGQQAERNIKEKRLRIAWPKGEDEAVWIGFDHDASMILESTMQGNVERKIETLTNIVTT